MLQIRNLWNPKIRRSICYGTKLRVFVPLAYITNTSKSKFQIQNLNIILGLSDTAFTLLSILSMVIVTVCNYVNLNEIVGPQSWNL